MAYIVIYNAIVQSRNATYSRNILFNLHEHFAHFTKFVPEN